MAENEEEYFKTCKRLGVAPDSSFLISLRALLPEVKFVRRLSEADLLAITDFLVPPCGRVPAVHVPATWDLSGSALGSNGAALVARLLRAGVAIETLCLSNCGIGPRGFRYLADAFAQGVSGTLRTLDLSHNVASLAGAQRFARALEGKHSLETLDLSCSNATFEGVFAVSRAADALNARRAASHARALSVVSHGNFVREEVWNSVTHGLGLALAIIGGIVLLTTYSALDALHIVSAAVFAASLVLVYASSFFYHSLLKVLVAKNIFHRFDRLSIYVLIAGTYTPFSLLSMHGTVGWFLLAVVWMLALVGICLDLVAFGKYQTLKLSLYLGMGWACVLVAVPYMLHPAMTLVGPSLLWLGAGGLFYTSGVIFFVLDRPAWHILWHVWVMFGSACHWICIYFYVMTAPLPNPPVDRFIY